MICLIFIFFYLPNEEPTPNPVTRYSRTPTARDRQNPKNLSGAASDPKQVRLWGGESRIQRFIQAQDSEVSSFLSSSTPTALPSANR